MNKLFTILFTLSTSFAFAQSLIAETYLEQTMISPKVGTAIGYKFAGNFEVGGFIQRSTIDLEPENGRPLNYEKEFMGAFFTYPVFTAYKAEVQMKVRTGVTNGQNFAITPSFHATFKPTPAIALGTGIGIRSFNPTFMASIQVRLNGKKNKTLLTSLK